MKTAKLFTLLLLLLPMALAAVPSPEIQVTMLSQSPDPVEPGQVVKVKFKVENLGKESPTDTVVKILPKFPFTLYGDEAEKNIGRLRALQTGADAAIVEFRLRVDPTAVEKDTEIELMVKVSEDSWLYFTENEFMVDIQTHDAVLDIVSITSKPEQIAPGQSAKISITIKNMADSLLKDIRFKLNLDSETIPLAPYQSSSERRLSRLDSGFQKSMEFELIAEPGASPGMYKVPLSVSYNDEKGNSYSIDDLLVIIVGERPKVNVYIRKSTVQQAGKEGKVTVEIANTGTNDLKFLELDILPSEDFELVSSSRYFYLGDVDSDDTEREELSLYIHTGIDQLILPVKISYHDANNKPYQQQFSLEMKLYSSSELKKFGLVQTSNYWAYLLIILIGAGGYWYYRRHHHKKKK